MCTVGTDSDFMLYYPCLEVEPGDLDDSRNTCTTVEPLDETRRWAVLTRRVKSLDPKEPRRRRPVLGGLPLTGRSVQALCPVNGRIVYQNQIRQDPRSPSRVFLGRQPAETHLGRRPWLSIPMEHGRKIRMLQIGLSRQRTRKALQRPTPTMRSAASSLKRSQVAVCARTL